MYGLRLEFAQLSIHNGVLDWQSANTLKNYAKKKWLEGYASDWRIHLYNSNTCAFYKTIKIEWNGMENYLKKMDINRLKIIAKFRLRSNHLPCSMFALRENPNLFYDCPICLEPRPDEAHYLLSCPYFTVERRQWLPNVNHLDTTADKVKFIFEFAKYGNLLKFCEDVMKELESGNAFI